ncbi:MAG: class I SAM-dependent methyltransferase [Opitutae bacterium]|nr:class I SAM-dependent methyltransferase [Opitutae bacterium]
MNPEEYANLEATERAHWYYAGKRELVRRWLGRLGALRREARLLDVGAGTGMFATEMAAHCEVWMLDDHAESLQRLRARFPAERVLEASGTGIPLPAASVDIVTALDVLEHIADDAAAVHDLARVLRPGGLAVITVPACMSLWSDWDVALHHHRRYDRSQLVARFTGPDWAIVHANYTNVLAFPAVWALRRLRRTRRQAGPRAEDRVPPAWLNRCLQSSYVALALSRVRFPIGVSLLLIARRRELRDAGN